MFAIHRLVDPTASVVLITIKQFVLAYRFSSVIHLHVVLNAWQVRIVPSILLVWIKSAKIPVLALAAEIRIAESSNIIRFALARTVLPVIHLLFASRHLVRFSILSNINFGWPINSVLLTSTLKYLEKIMAFYMQNN